MSVSDIYEYVHVLFHCIACDCYCADCDDLCDHLRDIPWRDIFKFVDSVAASEFCDWF